MSENKVTGLQRLNSYISHNATQEYLKKVLSDKKDAFVSNLVSLVANNAKLQECEPATLMYVLFVLLHPICRLTLLLVVLI